MKKTTWMGMLMVPALVGAFISFDRYALGAEEQVRTDTFETNGVAAVETNLPPVRTVLETTLPDGVDPASPFAQLARMVQAGVDKNVMLAYIKRSPRFFELNADDIIYLTDLGAPSEVIEAAIARDQELMDEGISTHKDSEEPEAVDAEADDQPPEVTVDQFYDTLSPYGTWVYIEGYGRCWRPTVVIYDAGWRPYCDNGRWVYTDRGWYWMSNYSWGWTTFHYGRWFYTAGYGWCWWPDTVWAPSWVYWRYNDSYCGWAPLPPHTVYRSGVGLIYRGSVVSVGFNFNLGATYFTFVSTRNFCDPNPRRYVVDRRQVARLYNQTHDECRFDLDQRRHTLVNHGIPTDRIRTATRQDLRPVSVRFNRNPVDSSRAPERFNRDRGSLIVQQHRPSRAYLGDEKRKPARGSGSSQNNGDHHTAPPPRQDGNGIHLGQGNQRSQDPAPATPKRKQDSQGSNPKQDHSAPVITPSPNQGSSGDSQKRHGDPIVMKHPKPTPKPANPASTGSSRVATQPHKQNPPARVGPKNSVKRPRPKVKNTPRPRPANPPAKSSSNNQKKQQSSSDTEDK